MFSFMGSQTYLTIRVIYPQRSYISSTDRKAIFRARLFSLWQPYNLQLYHTMKSYLDLVKDCGQRVAYRNQSRDITDIKQGA